MGLSLMQTDYIWHFLVELHIFFLKIMLILCKLGKIV